jgi:diguanylate cyclase (GGDEF)-like protein
MQTVASLDLITATVHPDERLGNLRVFSGAYPPRAVAVIGDGPVLGILSARGLRHMPVDRIVKEVMDPVRLHIDAGASVRRVAQEFLTQDLDAAVVVDGTSFLGLVTTHMLLREVGRSWDPLTGLGWSDRLREWGIARLREGREISVLFLDLDDFGMYNKRYGHIVGDYVLKLIAGKLKEYCESGRDTLVRYGGDEFAIGSLLTRDDAESFAIRIREEMSEIRLEEHLHTVGFCIGVFGGRRSHERDQTHYAATMDNLINAASRLCMSQKNEKVGLIDN